MKVLLLGSSGMLGQAINVFLSNIINMDIIKVDLFDSDYIIDLTDDDKLNKLLVEIKPDVIINSAAIVNLLFCESNPEKAYMINGRMPGLLADYCEKNGTYFIHISTDHYYKGDGKNKHKESDRIYIYNEYARSKYIGESFIKDINNSIVIRTNIVGFRGIENKPTFIEWALKEISNGTKLTLFNDFYTSSIHTKDLANIIFDIMNIRPSGIFNIASSQVTTKEEFICGLSKACLDIFPNYDIGSVNNDSNIIRGDSLGLDVTKAEDVLGYKLPDFEETIYSIRNAYIDLKRY